MKLKKVIEEKKLSYSDILDLSALDKQKIKSNEKIEAEREASRRSIEFLKEQVAYKDKRMDLLLDAVSEKDKLHKEMLEKILRCSKCEKYED